MTKLDIHIYYLSAISVMKTKIFGGLLVLCTGIVQAEPVQVPVPVVQDTSMTSAGESLSESSAFKLQREASVLRLLRGFEWRLDVEGFRSLPDNCWEELLRIANDQRFMKVTRSRASIALTLFTNDSVWIHMQSRLGGKHAGRGELDTSDANSGNHIGKKAVMRRRAVDQMCVTFAVDRAKAVEGNMISLLTEVDPQLRVRAARCLKLMATEPAREALLEYKTKLQHSSALSRWELEALDH